MATRLPPVDIVIVGMGWTGGILARSSRKPVSDRSRSSVARPAARRMTSRAGSFAMSCATRSATT